MADIETVWEEYWLRLMDGLNGVRGEEMRRASGSAMEVVLRRGSDLICQGKGGGATSVHDEQNAKVLCAPTRAGGETVMLHDLLFQRRLLAELKLICSRIYSGGSEGLFRGRFHSGWSAESAYSSAVTDCWR